MKVRINLSALTRMTYEKIVEVPDGISDTDLDELIDKTYDDTDVGEFTEDFDFFEKGDSCYWERVFDETEVTT